MRYYQQGDVLIKPVEHIPRDAELHPGAVLAEGQLPGRAHQVLGEGVTLCSCTNELYLSAPRGAAIVHPEHKPIRVPAGRYRIDRVREFDHFGVMAENGPGWRGLGRTAARAQGDRPRPGGHDDPAMGPVTD